VQVKDELASRPEKDLSELEDDQDDDKKMREIGLSDAARSVEFLFHIYRPRFWYWEVIKSFLNNRSSVFYIRFSALLSLCFSYIH